MNLLQLFFILVALTTLVSAGMVVSARRMMHAALWLILTLLGVAVMFAMLEASFFTAVQVVIYIGGITILIIFAIMMTRRSNEDASPGVNRHWWLPALVSLFLFVGLVLGLSGWRDIQATVQQMPVAVGDIAGFGMVLVDPQMYLVPFEVASVLLLAAMIGAVTIVFDRRGGKS
jgi:NADH-quinone oxidoreductase subunit J